MKSIVCILLVAVTCSAWKLKPDDTPRLEQEREEFAAKNLESFVAGDEAARTSFYKEAGDILKAVQKNNDNVLGNSEPVERLMVKLSSGGLFDFVQMRVLQLLTNLIDGNRDNFSYYKLDAVREAAQRRLDAGVSGEEAETLQKLVKETTEARDALDTTAQAFVKGVKKIKELTADVGHEDHEEIQNQAKGMIAVGQANSPILKSGTANAIALVESRLRQ